MSLEVRDGAIAFAIGVATGGATAAVDAMRAAYVMETKNLVMLSDGMANVGGTPKQMLDEARGRSTGASNSSPLDWEAECTLTSCPRWPTRVARRARCAERQDAHVQLLSPRARGIPVDLLGSVAGQLPCKSERETHDKAGAAAIQGAAWWWPESCFECRRRSSMMLQRLRTEQTILVHRTRAFHPCAADLCDLMTRVNEHRSCETPALAVGVIDASGVRVRVIEGAGPAVVSVGRHPACDLPLRHGDASMRHAVVVRDDRGVRILDMASSFGLTGRAEAPEGTWTFVRAGDSLIAASALRAGTHVGAIDELGLVSEGPEAQEFPQSLMPPPRQTPLRNLLDVLASPPQPFMKKAKPPASVQTNNIISLERLEGTVLMGRDARCQVRFTSDRVSRLHAALLAVRVGGVRRAMVVDLGSTNGTSVLQVRSGAIHEAALGPAGRGQLVAAGDMVDLAGEWVRIVGKVGAADENVSVVVHGLEGARGQE
jgi:pSer/pThr/pTyr-binding forkhead associated (FHA) protein